MLIILFFSSVFLDLGVLSPPASIGTTVGDVEDDLSSFLCPEGGTFVASSLVETGKFVLLGAVESLVESALSLVF